MNLRRLVVIVAFLVCNRLAAETADDLFRQGRELAVQYNARAAHDPAALAAIHQRFEAATRADPAHVGAILGEAISRLGQVYYDPEINRTLTELGLAEEGRNPFEPEFRGRDPLPKTAKTTDDLLALVRERVVPQVQQALDALGRIPDGWTDSLLVSSNELPLLRQKTAEIDLGDVAMMRGGLLLYRAALRMRDGYHASVPLADKVRVLPGSGGKLRLAGFNLQRDVLAADPQLGTIKDAGALRGAEELVEQAAAQLHFARQYILGERDPQEDDLIRAEMLKWPQVLVDSLVRPIPVEIAPDEPPIHVHARALFMPPYLTRAQIPTLTDQDDIRAGTFPDPTFSGLLPSMTQERLAHLLAWTPAASAGTADLFACAFGMNRFVAVGDGGMIQVSDDAHNWRQVDSGTRAPLQGVAAGGGLFVAVGKGGTIVTSPDGTAWRALPAAGVDLEGVAFGNGRWVAVGRDGAVLVSADGADWQRAAAAGTKHLWGVAAGDGRFMAVGDGDTVLVSADGATWQAGIGPGAGTLNDVAFGAGRFVAVGSGMDARLGACGRSYSSTDGIAWSSSPVTVPGHLWGVSFGDDRFVATGDEGALLAAGDGRAWDSQFSKLNGCVWGCAAGAGQTVAVGNNGQIIVSRQQDGQPLLALGSLQLPSLDPRALFDVLRGRGDRREVAKGIVTGSWPTAGKPGRAAAAAEPAAPIVPPVADMPPPAATTATPEPAPAAATPEPAAPQPGAPAPASVALTLLTPKAAAGAGGSIQVRVGTVAGATDLAWIGFYRDGTADSRDYIAYTYLNNLVDSLYDVPVPAQPGAYHFRVFRDDNYDESGRSASVAVTE